MKDASGRSKGCGIVEYRTPAEAQEAINTLLDTELKGRLIFVREDREAAGVCVCVCVCVCVLCFVWCTRIRVRVSCSVVCIESAALCNYSTVAAHS